MTIRCLVLFAPLLLGGCYGLAGHDEMDRYFQRSDTLTMTAAAMPSRSTPSPIRSIHGRETSVTAGSRTTLGALAPP
ncbi:hypothetical protein ABIF50_004844 [Bradyrhizobium diazoefficiens]